MQSTPDHAARGHSRWSASASARNFACPGALALIEASGVEDRETEAAAWGTVCHQVAERCLRSGADASAHTGETVKTERFTFRFDDEMAKCTQVFLDYVRGRIEEYEHEREFSRHPDDPAGWNVPKATLLVEQYFDLSTPLKLPIEAGGTGDAVLLFPAWQMVEVVDLKTGKKWVNAEGNPQTRHYGLGAALSNKGGWTKIRTTIVQPPFGDDCVRSEDFGIDELFDWTADLKAAVLATSIALGEKARLRDPEQWARAYLRPGDHCHSTWCPVRATCPALQRQAMERARVFFQPVTDEDRTLAVTVPPDPASLDTDRLVAVLDAAGMIESWLNAVRAHAHEKVERGEKVGDYVLVPKQARRKWKDGVDEDDVLAAVEPEGLQGLTLDDVLTEPALKSPAQVGALLKTKERKALIADLWTSESSGTNLVRADKTKRGQVPARAQRFFEPIKE